MSLIYNVDFEIAAAAFMLILLIFLIINYSNRSDVNREFQKLAVFVLCTDIMDVVTAVLISYGGSIPNWLNQIVNTGYFLLVAVLAYRFTLYAMAYVYSGKKNKKQQLINRCIFLIYIASLILNLFLGYFFSFNEAGSYVHGAAYIVVYIVPCYYILYTGGILISHYKEFSLKQRISIGVFIALGISGSLIQMLFLPDILLGIFTVCLGVLVMLFSLETPDYQNLLDTMEQVEFAQKEAVQAKEEAQMANQAKTRFLQNISHEIRTPINAVMGYNEMIIRETKEQRTASYASNVQTAGRSLVTLVNEIMDFASIDGTFVLETAPYSLLTVIQDVVTNGEYNAKRKNLKFSIQVDEKLPQSLIGDGARLLQVMNHLVFNAIKYTWKGGIEVRIEWQETALKHGIMTVAVKDTGVGMKESDRVALAENGGLGDPDIQRVHGLGLGLSIVTRVLQLMHSKLEIESELGKGSTFSFRIEQEVAEQVPLGKVRFHEDGRIKQADELEGGFYAPSARILAADDNALNLNLIRNILKETQIQIDTVATGEEALVQLEKNKYHIVLLDYMMPHLNGMETLKQIQERNLCPETPVIILLASTVTEVRDSYLQAGFADCLTKPIDNTQLLALMKRHLPAELILEKQEYRQPQEKPIRKKRTGTFLDQLSLLDTEAGMAYSADNLEFYRDMLLSYAHSDRYEEIQQSYRTEDWENYAAQLHALKGTSFTIGARQLSQAIEDLEQAVKEGKTLYVVKHHQAMMDSYQLVRLQIMTMVKQKSQEETDSYKVREAMSRILVVDDDDVSLQIAEKILAGKYEVTCVSTGKDALKLMETERPNLILVSLNMPEMDGFVFNRRLKETPELKEIPVILMRSDNDEDAEIRGFQEGIQDFIKKPFIEDIVIQRIDHILELSRLQKNLRAEVKVQSERFERLSLQLMETLAGAIDAKDEYTNGHSMRVAAYSREIARRFGESEKEQEDIYYMALLHDIGKIGVPDVVITKEGKLTESEYDIVKNHPSIGAEILKHISEIPGVDAGARWHHEKYDGTGYPDGLKGEEIPIVARIIGVADSYDAMASTRSYRKVMPQEAVRAEIEKGRGTQFDPVFADIMLEMIDEDKEYKMRGE